MLIADCFLAACEVSERMYATAGGTIPESCGGSEPRNGGAKPQATGCEQRGGAMAERVGRNYLRTKTRNPRFLWQMVFAILAIGIFGGMAAQFLKGDGAEASFVLAPSDDA